MADPVLLSDPRIAAVHVAECGEPLVDLRRIPEVVVDQRKVDAAGTYAHVRHGVATRLSHAARRLPPGHALVVVEGHRPADLQRRYFTEYVDFLVSRHPGWSEEELRIHASRYVPPPDVAGHTSGGAVDVTLAVGGTEAWMGTAVNASPEESDGACFTDAPRLSEEVRRLRSRLRWAMQSAGFVNVPAEWWHWSYGDRYWAYVVGAPNARYGPVSGPPTGPGGQRQRRRV